MFFNRREHIENIEKLCAQLCETLCNKKKKDHKVTRRIAQSNTKKTLRNIICLARQLLFRLDSSIE